MKSRLIAVSIAMLTAAQACLAADPNPNAGKAAIGGQLGLSRFVRGGDYSGGAAMRFAFSGHWRYAVTPWLRWEVSPGFQWTGYDEKARAPFRDLNFPNDSTKKEYLTLLVPVTAQLHYTLRRGQWVYYAGGGSGVYRVWVENRRKVLEDPVSHKLHRGVYPGASGKVGVEHVLKAMPSVSLELAVEGHGVLARRDEQFPSGFNGRLLATSARFGANYHFTPGVARVGADKAPNPRP